MKHLGGVASNSLTHILQLNNTDSIAEFPPQIIHTSSYYDCDNFISLIKSTNSSNFCAFSSNIQSVNARFSELHAFIVDLESSNFYFGVICLQESWLNANDDITQIKLDHYNCVIQGKTCSSKGGLMMYIHEKFNYKVKNMETNVITGKVRLLNYLGVVYLNQSLYATFSGRLLT